MKYECVGSWHFSEVMKVYNLKKNRYKLIFFTKNFKLLFKLKSTSKSLNKGVFYVMTEIVKVQGLQKKFGRIQALSDVTFTVEAGEVVGLDRKSTRLNSSHVASSYAVFCV